MADGWPNAVWNQLGAAIDALERAIRSCPDGLWSEGRPEHSFGYVAFHTLFFLDYYLSESEPGFAPPAPFALTELDPAGALPDRAHTREELLEYLRHGREKARRRLAGLTAEVAQRPCGFERRHMTVGELLLYTLRHVQHHTGQLNLRLRQETGSAPPWVARAGDGLPPA